MGNQKPRVSMPLAAEAIHPEARAELERQLAAHGRVTNMKRTLSRSPAAFAALMTWYPLRDEVASFLGDRATTLFAYAVSTQADCLICSTFFRRIIIEVGENPEQLQLDHRTNAVIEYGRAIAKDSNAVPCEVFDRVRAFLDENQLVALTAFAAMMIATNIFNNALEIELDGYLWAYRRHDGD